MSNSPNKNYNLQVTGSNIGTWGTVLNNSVFSIIDANLGGTLAINVGGNSNINLTASQTQNLIHNLTGVLTGNINYVFPAQGGFFAINNKTTGAFTVTVTVVGGTGGIVVPQGTTSTVYIDATVPAVYGFSGTIAQFSAASVGGSANAITIPTTIPANFTLANAVVYFFPTAFNTGSVTLNVAGTGAFTVQKIGAAGLVNLAADDLSPGVPIVVLWNGSEWIALNVIYEGIESTVSTNQSVTFANLFYNYVNTAAITYTITETTNLSPVWFAGINALGGTATITPNSADIINVNGKSLTAGTSYKIPQGASAQLTTDANGNLFINYIGNLLNTEFTIASATTTDLGTSPSNIVAISGTTTITGFGSSASASNPLYFIRFSGALTLTYNATSLILPGAANITTAAGDTAVVKYEGSGNWRVLSYNAASGKPVGGSGLVVGTTVIAGGANGSIEFNNAGILGEKATTGSGNVVLATSPTLVTPALGTPSSGNLSNCTNVPVGLMTALAVGSIISASNSGGVVAGASTSASNITPRVTSGASTTGDIISGTWQALTTNPGGNVTTLWQRIA